MHPRPPCQIRTIGEFAGAEDAKAEIRAAVGYLLRGATGGARGDITQAIISTVRQVAAGLPPERPIYLDVAQ